MNMEHIITIAALGPDSGDLLTMGALSAMKAADTLILRTARHGAVMILEEQGVAYKTLDGLYERCEDFDEHAQAAAEAVGNAAAEGDVVYGVFDVRDRSVAALMDRAKNVRVVAGPPAEGALFARAQGSVQMLEASDWEKYSLSSSRSALIRELDSRELASEVKLKLMEIYPDETAVYVRMADGTMAHTELFNLDRVVAHGLSCTVACGISPDQGWNQCSLHYKADS